MSKNSKSVKNIKSKKPLDNKKTLILDLKNANS